MITSYPSSFCCLKRTKILLVLVILRRICLISEPPKLLPTWNDQLEKGNVRELLLVSGWKRDEFISVDINHLLTANNSVTEQRLTKKYKDTITKLRNSACILTSACLNEKAEERLKALHEAYTNSLYGEASLVRDCLVKIVLVYKRTLRLTALYKEVFSHAKASSERQ